MTSTPRVIDYEGSKYSTEFWTPPASTKIAPSGSPSARCCRRSGERLIDIGAGAGRLGDLYLGYDEVILMDYARSTVVEARDRWQHDPRFKFVAADLYPLPFVDGAFDSVVMIRVIHHIVDVPRALGNIAAALQARRIIRVRIRQQAQPQIDGALRAAQTALVAVRSIADRVCGVELRLPSGVDEDATALRGLHHSIRPAPSRRSAWAC